MLLTGRLTTEEFAEKQWRLPLWLVKILKYEYWPLWLFYLPLIPAVIWFIIKHRSFSFYIYANPGIENGGFAGESKKRILDSIDPRYKPITNIFSPYDDAETIKDYLNTSGINFPVIAKPDIGEQGKGVEKIISLEQLEKYVVSSKENFIIQEYVNAPFEFGVFYIKHPGHLRGRVTSLTAKRFLSVTGNGVSTIEELMQLNDRARLQIVRLKKKGDVNLQRIPKYNEYVLLEPIGNHCLGTEFIDANHLINDRLNFVFDAIASSIPGFHYGRFDLRVPSVQDLQSGQNIKILELNGAGSIPGHIFDPSYKLLNAYIDVIQHWKAASEIAFLNKNNARVPVK
jgi:hypothetical protein